MQETLVRKIHWRRDMLPTPVFWGFPCGSAGRESACNVGDLGSIPGLGGSPGEGKGYPLQYSGMENSMDCIVHGVAKSWTRPSYRTTSLMLLPTEAFQCLSWRPWICCTRYVHICLNFKYKMGNIIAPII